MSARRNVKALRLQKVGSQGLFCRVGGACEGSLEYAHLMRRGIIAPVDDNPDLGVMLCHKHHTAFDAGQLDIDHILTPQEASAAVLFAGTIEAALRRLRPVEYRNRRRLL